MSRLWRFVAAGLALLALGVGVFAQDQPEPSPAEEAKKQRQQLLEQGGGILPSDLYVAQGEELFKAVRGPKGVSLEGCDFGRGAGQVEGVVAQLPRYFPDTGRVEDLDSRIRSCMIGLQGFKPEEVKRSEVIAIAFYLASLSHEATVDVRLATPQEKRMYALGEELFWVRAGPRDMGCATCHVTYRGKRSGVLPLSDVVGEKVAAHWPAYRYSNDSALTMEDRIRTCYSNLGMPAPDYYSDAVIALGLWLAVQSNGAKMDLPGFIR
ncbi:sulfur oxidation c-type cytochrome SoxA [Calidithermus roseus]|uniref:SoxAX cytochrome complex subunit A n=1 Tax=Calidithermus roseus TaxID=1644118 RepID=A0A399F464_9DEIN|nr:sulfur oxidation c-type cytochrome SoxA [Calidithermus roseus]RIH89411.1 SoxAX cytochrome complex subunit A2 [Calidithermus roseus]